MPVTIHIPTALRKFTGGAQSVELPVASLPDLLDQLVARFPEISRHLRDDSGELRRFLNIYVNDEDIRFIGGVAYAFKDGDDVLLVPAIAGGASDSGGVEVRVPATSANLGCAFDCAALAVNRYLRARATASREPGIGFFYSGTNSERIGSDGTNLLISAMRRFAELHGSTLPNLRVDVESEIPVGVGFGSSAAAIVAGLVLSAKLLNIEIETDEILSLAAKIEDHPDNTSAAFLGGLTVAFLEEKSGRVQFAKAQMPADLRIIAIVPSVPLATHSARAILPVSYSRENVVHNLQRTALLTAACFSGSFAIDPEFFRDRLHQPYRSKLIPGMQECLDVKHPALLGVFLSGAGSSVLALVRDEETEVAEILAQGMRSHGVSVDVLHLRPENRGVLELAEGARNHEA